MLPRDAAADVRTLGSYRRSCGARTATEHFIESLLRELGAVDEHNRLSRDGILAINGSTQANVLINAAGFGWLKLPFNCKTTEPANFDLDWEGPIADFGAGGIVFEGETEFAELECGWMTSLFNALVAGPGQEYSFRLVPPAPDRL